MINLVILFHTSGLEMFPVMLLFSLQSFNICIFSYQHYISTHTLVSYFNANHASMPFVYKNNPSNTLYNIAIYMQQISFSSTAVSLKKYFMCVIII